MTPRQSSRGLVTLFISSSLYVVAAVTTCASLHKHNEAQMRKPRQIVITGVSKGLGRALVDLGAASPGTAVRGGGGVFPGTPAAAATVVFFHTYMPPLALTAQAAQLAEPQVRKPPAPKLSVG